MARSNLRPKKLAVAPRDRGGKSVRTLAVDIGGSGIKALVLDEAGKPLTERARIATPAKATPKQVMTIIRRLAEKQGDFDRASVGFPGVVKDGVVYTAANLGKGWKGFELEKELARKLKRPVRVANDADVQGLGCVDGEGIELVITLGTGFGSVLFAGRSRIHLELGHHPFHHGKTYEEELGSRALHKKGRKKWNKLLREAIDDLQRTFNYDRLYIGGGDAKSVDLKLPGQVQTVDNMAGLLGGIALWREESAESPKPTARLTKAGVKTVPARVSESANSDGAGIPPEPAKAMDRKAKAAATANPS
ncbi:MAG TPA: ROK family protein [Candidatus Binataceae bacterium]|nr:ROK family protein [Candidatus Binataceae bacterium]